MKGWRTVLGWKIEPVEKEPKEPKRPGVGYWYGGYDKRGFVRQLVRFFQEDGGLQGSRFDDVFEVANDMDRLGYFDVRSLKECARKAYQMLREREHR